MTPAGNNGYYCSLHGSKFDKDDRVRKGPAQKPLERYYTSVENNNLIIYILKSPLA